MAPIQLRFSGIKREANIAGQVSRERKKDRLVDRKLAYFWRKWKGTM